ncbi:MAG: hypothetical protein LWX56_10735 [Ignavibacteria bacterium]|nr:hypothetical protein [Ignavibacteria bacterium]
MSIPGAVIIEGHVQGLANLRALSKEGIPVIVVDKVDCVARHSQYCKGFFKCPDFQTDEFADFLVDLARKENLQGWVLIPSNDHAVFTISRNAARIREYYKTVAPDMQQLETISNKGNLIEMAIENGVPAPRSYFPSTYELDSEKLYFPLLVKGKYGLSFYKKLGQKAFLVANREQLDVLLAKIEAKIAPSDLILQELIPFDKSIKTISFTSFSVNGEIHSYWIGSKVREHPIRFGTATMSESISCPELLAPSAALLRKIGYTGVCEIEYLKDPRDGEYKLIEINPRTWLWVGLAIACGINYPVMIYNYVNNLQQNYPAEYRIGVKWRNRITDYIYSTIGVLTGEFSLEELVKQNEGEIIDALLYPEDNKPFVAYIQNMFKFLRNR